MIFPLESKTSNKLTEGYLYNAIRLDQQVAFLLSNTLDSEQTNTSKLTFHVVFQQTKNFPTIATGFRRGWGETPVGEYIKREVRRGKYLAESETRTRLGIPSGELYFKYRI